VNAYFYSLQMLLEHEFLLRGAKNSRTVFYLRQLADEENQ